MDTTTRQNKLRQAQAEMRQQLAKPYSPTLTVITTLNGEAEFLRDVEEYIKLHKIRIRTSQRVHRSFFVDYQILPSQRKCTSCTTKKHYKHIIGINYVPSFECPECKAVPPSVFVQVRWANKIYKIDRDSTGQIFRSSSDANHYLSVLDDKAHCGSQSHVYIIQAGSDGNIKIGFSSNILKRITSLRTASPSKLNVLLILSGGVNIESLLHHHFNQHHSHGEWFKPHPDIMKFIEHNQEFCQKKSLGVD